MRRCPKCKHDNVKDDATVCKWCHEAIPAVGHEHDPQEVPSLPAVNVVSSTKRCPFCAEEIQAAAIVCKHCGRELIASVQTPTPPPPPVIKKTSRAAWGCLTLLVLVGVFVVVAVMNQSSGPTELTSEHRAAVERALKDRGLDQPSTISVSSSGFVVADYVLSASDVAVRARQIGETRLLVIREALLPFGFKDYRVNVNGPPPGTGLVQRYGSARFIGDGGRLEWLTP